MTSLVTVVGNRPQFVKMLPVSRAIAACGKKEFIIHTGQHYDDALSAVFFRELKLPHPDVHLSISSARHGAMTGEILAKLEGAFIDLKPRGVLVYGDTNSTLAAALAAAKLNIPIAHVEAGPRMYDLTLPEEINRRLVDHMSRLLFCPDQVSVGNLKQEGITAGVHFTGDVMLDSFRICSARTHMPGWAQYRQLKEAFVFLTLHRPANVDSPEALEKIHTLLTKLNRPVLFPIHLRTQKRLEEYGMLDQFKALRQHVFTPPMGYLDTLAALVQCQLVITDSGGLQKEAFFARKPAVVLLDATPWPDLKESGWQRVAGTLAETTPEKICEVARDFVAPDEAPAFYGDEHAAEKIVQLLITEKLL